MEWTAGKRTDSERALLATQRAFQSGMVLCVLAAGAFFLLHLRTESVQRRLIDALRASRLTGDAYKLAVDRETGLRGYLLTGDTISLQPEREARPELVKELDTLLTASKGTPDAALVVNVQRALRRWEVWFAEPVLDAPDPSATALRSQFAGKMSFDQLRVAFDSLKRAQEREFVAVTSSATRERQRVTVGIIVICLLLGVVLLWLRRLLVSQIAMVGAQHAELARQHDALRADAESIGVANEELSILSETLQEQAIQMEEHAAELEQRNALLTSLREELQKNSEEEHALLAALPEYIAIFDSAGRYVSTPSPNLLPGAPVNRVGLSLEEIYPPLASAAIRKAVTTSLEHRKTVNFDFSLAAPDTDTIEVLDAGGLRWYTGSAVALAPDRSLCVAHDVTSRVLAESALRERDERHQALVCATSEAIWDIHLAKSEIIWSDMLGATFGYTEAVRDVSYWKSRIHQDDLEGLVRAAAAAMEQGASLWETECRFMRADDSYAVVQVRGCILLDDSRKPYRMVGSMADVTARRTLEGQLRQSQKMDAIGQLAGGVAHDFNNLLTVITSYAEMALATVSPNDPTREAMQEILGAADDAAALTRQLLTFSRQTVRTPAIVVLNDTIAESEQMLRRLLPEHIAVDTRLAQDADLVEVDPHQIGQILMNLAVNARDAMPDGGSLTIETARVELDAAYAALHRGVTPGPYVMLSVADTGTGMGADTLEHMFEPFFTTKPLGAGTGLGLATVYGIVNQSQGHIWVYSELGHGTTFKIYFPACVPDPDAEQPTASPPIAAAGGETVLVVDDNERVRKTVVTALRFGGYTVYEAGNGAQALEMLRAGVVSPAMVVTDVVMPVMGAAEFIPAMRSFAPSIRVLLLSGYSRDRLEHAEWCVDLDFLEKPFTMADLLLRMRTILGHSASQLV